MFAVALVLPPMETMTLQQVSQFWCLGYTVLLLVGGVMGYAKVKSQKSLIAGIISAVLMAVVYGFSSAYPGYAYAAGAAVAVGLTAVFVIRFRKTGAFMPAGLMSAVSGVSALLLGITGTQALLAL